ncbi:hypothetical protein SAMN05421676_10242 [Salinibacillus kushneri]|uniref:Uncharacterized protein n=1 Tax=Salinibacillus kushneri TaxID=237682 RepID=A0A1I0A5A2_9BACI|nr:hypothetical protein [Salinibacillus kushneri]SES89354.1 hypothetical protein SAMN05421676_10242 [Salinibacillus kushneri]
MADTRKSTNYNKEKLEDGLGLKRLSNTTIYLKDNEFVLSPSVQNQHKWFDIRKVNLDRFNEKPYKGHLLIRYFDKFLLTDLDRFIQKMTPTEKYIENQNIGIHWKFNVEEQQEGYTLINRQDRTLTYNITEYSIEEIRKLI